MRHEESNLQQSCVAWFRLQYPRYALRLWAIPNAGKVSRITGAILKREGCLPGVSDLMLSLPRGGWAGMFIEMKAGKKGRVSDAQKAFIEEHHADYYCIVCRDFDSFRLEVTNYLNLKPTPLNNPTP